MKNGQVPVALASAYFLGRSHKMRWVLPLAGIAAGGRLRPGGGGVGAKLLDSPEIDKLKQTLRDEVVSAGKTAAVAVVGSRIDSLSDRMQRRASSLRAATKAEESRDEEEPRGEEEAEKPGDEEEKERPAEKAGQREKGRSARTRAPGGGRTRTRTTSPAADKKKTRAGNSKSTGNSKSASHKTASSRRTASSGSSGSGGSAQRGRG